MDQIEIQVPERTFTSYFSQLLLLKRLNELNNNMKSDEEFSRTEIECFTNVDLFNNLSKSGLKLEI